MCWTLFTLSPGHSQTLHSGSRLSVYPGSPPMLSSLVSSTSFASTVPLVRVAQLTNSWDLEDTTGALPF